jgi:hypothetical protein
MQYYEQARLLPAPPQEWIFELRESTGVPEPHELNAQYYWGNNCNEGSTGIDHDGWIAVEAGVQATAPTGDGVIET